MIKKINSYVNSLLKTETPTGFLNPYSNPQAVNNLKLFLSGRQIDAPVLLLVGEAPGQRGATITGVPLCSPDVLCSEWNDPWQQFGPKSGYKLPPESISRREATSTIVWTALAELFPHWPCPVTWNAVPFQPEGLEGRSNGSVKTKQINFGQDMLAGIIELFPSSIPVALGKRAAEALAMLGIECFALRHPSYGGKKDFIEGLIQLKQQFD